MVTVISFYTKDWRYSEYASKMRKDCDLLQIDNVIEELPSTGSYLKNTCLKPRFILDKLKQLKSPVLWVDVDAKIMKRPDIFCIDDFDKRYDFAAKKMSEQRTRTWHVGTIYCNYTHAMIQFLEEWIKNTGEISDESALEFTWQNNKELLRTTDIPNEYFFIQRLGFGVPQDTVIMHRISSGESKKREMPNAIKRAKEGIY